MAWLTQKALVALARTGASPAVQESIVNYVEHALRPGHFLCAVIANDLAEAVARADDAHQAALCRIVSWFYQHAPGVCWGSRASLSAWLERRAGIVPEEDRLDLDAPPCSRCDYPLGEHVDGRCP